VVLPVRLALVIESLLGGGPNGFTGRGLPLPLLFRRMLDSTCSHSVIVQNLSSDNMSWLGVTSR